MSNITVRQINFDLELDKEFNAEVIPGEVEISYMLVGISLILPYLEPYLIRHSVEAQEIVSDQELKHDMSQFCKQEGQHYRQHAQYNDRVREKYPELVAMEKKVKQDYERFSARGAKFNLAFAEGFESFTCPFIIFMCNSGMLRDMTDPLADIYAWHFLEEFEHRTVAYDAYYHFHDSYWYRLWVSIIAQAHLLKFALDCTRIMLRKERKLFHVRGGWYGRLSRIWKWTRLSGKYMLPQLWKTYLPHYNPRNIIVPDEITYLAEIYNARSSKKFTV